MPVTATILNRLRLQRKLDKLPAAAKQAIRLEMAKQADEIVALAKRLVPVDTGRLRDSIGWTWGRVLPAGRMRLADIIGADLTLTIYAGSDKAFYARWVEFGTTQNPATPFFFVSYRANRSQAKRAIRQAVRKSARAVAQA